MAREEKSLGRYEGEDDAEPGHGEKGDDYSNRRAGEGKGVPWYGVMDQRPPVKTSSANEADGKKEKRGKVEESGDEHIESDRGGGYKGD
jgi:hypothetical protein